MRSSVTTVIALLVVAGCGGSTGQPSDGGNDGAADVAQDGGDDGAADVATDMAEGGPGCTEAPEPNRYYVDPQAAVGQSGFGTRHCPFLSLDMALAIHPTAPFTVCTQGTFDDPTDGNWPKIVPANVTLDGTYCGQNSTRTLLVAPNGMGGVTFAGAPAAIHGFDIIGLGLISSSTTAGILVSGLGTNATIEVEDLMVGNFYAGISVADSALQISNGAGGVSCTGNGFGLGVVGNSTLLIMGGQRSDTAVVFNDNDPIGIEIAGGVAVIVGQDYTGTSTLSRTVTANGNGVGLAIGGAQATIEGLETENDSVAGVEVVDSASLTLTGSVITGNGNGISVSPATGSGAPDVSHISLGRAASGAQAGHNQIFANKGAAVCMTATPTGTMSAMGNIWSADASKDCTGTPTAPLTHTPDCTAQVDVARGSQNMTVDGCTFQ
jgi:hypothetical protein